MLVEGHWIQLQRRAPMASLPHYHQHEFGVEQRGFSKHSDPQSLRHFVSSDVHTSHFNTLQYQVSVRHSLLCVHGSVYEDCSTSVWSGLCVYRLLRQHSSIPGTASADQHSVRTHLFNELQHYFHPGWLYVLFGVLGGLLLCRQLHSDHS